MPHCRTARTVHSNPCKAHAETLAAMLRQQPSLLVTMLSDARACQGIPHASRDGFEFLCVVLAGRTRSHHWPIKNAARGRGGIPPNMDAPHVPTNGGSDPVSLY